MPYEPWTAPPPRKPIGLTMDVRIPQYPPNARFDAYRERLRPREGGIADRPPQDDPGGLTNKGVATATLQLFRQTYPSWNLPPSVTDLTDRQIADIYRHEYYERPQIDALASVPGLDETGSKLAEHVFDSVILSNPVDVGTWLQQSLDETLRTDLRSRSKKSGFLFYDGILGSRTRNAMEQAVQQDKILDVSRKFWDKREQFLGNRKNTPNNAGWKDRLKEFRE